MFGCFINDVILRSQLDDEQTGVALLEQVKETLSDSPQRDSFTTSH